MSETAAIAEQVERAWAALAGVSDPEIPVLSVVDLGIINGVEVNAAGEVRVRMTPTFVGCPALELMQEQMADAIRAAGFAAVRVDVEFDPPWTSDRISETGLARLREFGLAPPARSCERAAGPAIESNFVAVPCPLCGSRETDLESFFGPTLCRSIHYCRACRQSFEHFKPVG